jgi:hypothetical protein
MRTMRGAKSIVNVNISELRQRFSEPRIIRFFLGLEPEVLELDDIAIVHVRDDFLRRAADRVVAEYDRMID